MFKNLKFKYKILLLPLLATLAFLIILGVNEFLGAKNQALLDRIRTGYAPALELSRDLEVILASIQRSLQDAVAIKDTAAVEEIDSLRDTFLKRLEGEKENPTIKSEELSALRGAFDDYYLLARKATLEMIGGKNGATLLATLEAMRTKYNGIKEALQANTLHNKKEMTAAFVSAQKIEKTFMTVIATITLLCIVILGGLSAAIIGGINKPLGEVSAGFVKMAAGDLTIKANVSSSDEIGVLAHAFNEMAAKLRSLISQVQKNTTAITRVTVDLQETGGDISKQAGRQESAMEDTSSSVAQLSASIGEVNDNVGLLSISANDTSSFIIKMDMSMGEVAEHMDSLTGSIDGTSSSIGKMIVSIKNIAEGIGTLQQVTDETASSLHELSASVRQVEENAHESHSLSDKTSKEARKGMDSVGETITGMKEIQASFTRLQEIVERLSEKSESIGKITRVIDQVTRQTNLLSLNASIIAAQAGEHGRGFSVVAEEIKSLADQTIASTREIVSLIEAVQTETANAVSATAQGSERVKRGVSLSGQAGDLLKVIIESSEVSTEKANQIAKATQEQVSGIQVVDQAMYKVKEMVQQINLATREQEETSAEIVKATEDMRMLGQQVKVLTQEQSKGSKFMTTAIEKIMVMIRHILNATEEQSKGSRRIEHAVEVFKETTNASVQRAAELNKIVTVLSDDSKKLEEEISRFKI